VKKIEFILPKVTTVDNEEIRRSIGLEHPPQPAMKFVPEEYKNLVSYTDNDLRAPTVKKCVPFLDALTSGYVIPFYQDYLITIDYEKKEWDVRSNLHKPSVHSPEQLPKNYQEGRKPIGKFGNKWIIKTPPGYSCLFIHPMNTPKTDFEIISGVVDTDIYEDTILFPYYLRRHDIGSKEKVQIHIKLGTPMVQVIPFKREHWRSWSGVKTEENAGKWRNKWAGNLLNTYKKFYWQKKYYD
jgi:hypothetical protein